jgi:hypothetical protein
VYVLSYYRKIPAVRIWNGPLLDQIAARAVIMRSGPWITGERFMPRPESKRINRDQYDAVLFDLDGVVTDTASIHATCWKQMFDQYLRNRARNRGEAFRPFELATDYGSTWMASLVSTEFATF